ncbi:hypothetical protein IW140_002688 [Coemansia sp. RSA 1813]|nr:hypothetical protein EV178_000236 [Coemansia sp. RSA 1646]KAJ1766837.1 hypothetical protein LPJ74_005681 [Coemansia sp. RSA 1843]KAJ2090456.1 hypothetical protein IW138_002667 [Coemansia sp. RSA 986]KAJ2215423.1 hypothetical protein EV179_002207 [Coemansia sp. RSA 487]KAJ2570012.1 hypothetical protein IW140_002688 [Coemansia sp. RSA 1813]
MESTPSPVNPSRRDSRFLGQRGFAEAARYITLTIALGGLQFAWSVETGFGSPYLLSLGLQKSVVSLVWLAGPLSGLVTQPLVGFLSDNCTSRLGRRRPYIIGATVGVVVCLTAVGWAREIAGDQSVAAIWLAVAAFYVLDFAINCIQASLRALIVDTLPASLQDDGTAWASRMIGIGNVLGYLMGFLDLPRLLPLLGSTQMQILTTIASAVLSLCVSVTCYSVKEVPITRPAAPAANSFKMFGSLITSMRSLPAVIKQIFRIQFFAWIGWFPFLFYSTTYVADLYIANHDGPEDDAIPDKATRAGSLAMFAHAVSSLGFSIVLPAFTYSAASPPPAHSRSSRDSSPAFPGGTVRSIWHRIRKRITVGLPTMWTLSLCVFALSMFLTLTISTAKSATLLMGVCGLSWAVAIWVPFSMLGEIISTSPCLAGNDGHAAFVRNPRNDDSYMQVASADSDADAIPLESIHHDSNNANGERSGRHGLYSQRYTESMSAGTVLGLHNVFVVVPQFITALASSLIFALFEHMEGPQPGPEGGQHAKEIATVLCLGGISSAVAAYYAWKLSRH